MSRGRVAFISEHASPVALLGSQDAGGQNVYVDEVSRNLADLGWDVDIFTRRPSPTDPDEVDWAPGVRVVNLDFGPRAPMLKDDMWPFMPVFRDRIREWVNENNRRYDVIHGNFWMSGWVAADLGLQLGVPVVQIFHATGLTKRRHQGDDDTSPPNRIDVELDVVRIADRIIAQCPAEASELIEDYGARPNRVTVIPSAVNIERFRPIDQLEARRQIGIPDNTLLVAYVGRMLPRKDPRNIVRALARLVDERDGDVQLMLVGGETREPDLSATPELGEIVALAERLGVADRLILTGKRQPDELHLYYSAADVAVTTPWYEPFGLTPLEAMACGTPVIGADVGGISYTIADGATGLLVPSRDPFALADALKYMLSQPELRTQMGSAARERVEQHFTWRRVAERTACLYDELCRDRSRAQSFDPLITHSPTR